MKLLIEISDEEYNNIKTHNGFNGVSLARIVEKGIPLPKGHGRLIDEKDVEKMIEESKVNSLHSKIFAENIIKFVPTIIEAENNIH